MTYLNWMKLKKTVFFGFDAELPTMCELDWKTTSVDQVVHPFSPDAVPGSVNKTVPGEGKAIDYFKIFLDDKYLIKICHFTNLNVARKVNINKHLGPWSELALEELKAYIGVDIVIKKFWGDCLEGIWNTAVFGTFKFILERKMWKMNVHHLVWPPELFWTLSSLFIIKATMYTLTDITLTFCCTTYNTTKFMAVEL